MVPFRYNYMKQDLSPHGMFPIGEKVQRKHTLRSLWFIPGGFGICNVNVVVCYSRGQTLMLTLMLGW